MILSENRYPLLDHALRQLVEALAKPLQAHRNADAFFGRLEDDEGRLLAAAQLLEQVFVHLHLGDAPVRQAAHETRAADVSRVDLQAEAGREEHAEGRQHPHESALLIRGLQYDHSQADVGAVLGRDALDQGALFALCAGRRVAADLPVAMHGLDRALRGGGHFRQDDASKGRNAGKRDPDQCTHGVSNVRGLTWLDVEPGSGRIAALPAVPPGHVCVHVASTVSRTGRSVSSSSKNRRGIWTFAVSAQGPAQGENDHQSRIASGAELWFGEAHSSVRGAIPERRSFAGEVTPCASGRLAVSGLESVGTSYWKERTHQCWCSCD